MKNLTIKIIVSVCLVLVFHSIKAQTTAQEFYEKAKLKYEQKDYQYAATLIDKAIALNDTNKYNYLLFKADILFDGKDYSYVIPTIKKAMLLKPKIAIVYNYAGFYYESFNQRDSSLYMFDKAISLAPTDSLKAIYISNRGTAKHTFRDFQGALIDFKEALTFLPNYRNTLNNLSALYEDLGDTVKAIQVEKQVIDIDPNFIGGYINLAMTYSEIDSLDKSIEYFNKAIQIDLNQPLIYSNRGFTYYKMKRYSEALKDINKSLEMYPSNSYAYKNLALVYFAQNNINEGCTALHYAEEYGYETNYGDEVKKLKEKYCKH